VLNKKMGKEGANNPQDGMYGGVMTAKKKETQKELNRLRVGEEKTKKQTKRKEWVTNRTDPSTSSILLDGKKGR